MLAVEVRSDERVGTYDIPSFSDSYMDEESARSTSMVSGLDS